MRRLLLVWLALVLTLAVTPGCATRPPDTSGLGNGWRPDHSLVLTYATGFRIDYYAGDAAGCPAGSDAAALAECEVGQYALITIADQSRFLVVPEGRPVPPRVASDVTVLTRPLTNVYLAASATMSLVVALDALPAVGFSALAADAWYLPEARAAMESGRIRFGGKYSAPDYEMLVAGAPSLAIENTMINHAPQVKEKLVALGIPVLVEQSSYESHPLGRTEWIKLFGALLGKQPLALARFAEQQANLDRLAGRPATGRTVAFFHISTAGYVVTRKSGDYIPRLIELAGGSYVFSDLTDGKATSTINLEMEKFYATARDADVIVYNSTVGGDLHSMAELVALNPLLAEFRAVRTGDVWCTGRDFYQDMMGMGVLVTDLDRVLTDPQAPDRLTYLHRLR